MKQPEVSQDTRQVDAGQAPYEPPTMVVLGSVRELTENVKSGGTDNMVLGTVVSDRALKVDVRAVDVRAVREAAVGLSVSGWRYRGDDESVRHIGPMAQDFAAAFAVGSDDRHIEVVDAFGVALACIQALHEQLRESDAQIDALRAELHALRARLDEREPSLVTAD